VCWCVKLTGEGHSQYVGLESAIALFGPIILRMPLPYPTLPYPGALPYPKTGKNQTGLASCVRSDCRLLWFPGSSLHHWQTNGSIELITTSSLLSSCLNLKHKSLKPNRSFFTCQIRLQAAMDSLVLSSFTNQLYIHLACVYICFNMPWCFLWMDFHPCLYIY